MNKLLFLSLFKSKETKPQENNNLELLLPELPFYGIGGTICRIEEAPESYYKVLYNQDGTINSQKIPVPKKKNKNLNLLLKDYYEDLKNYLDKFQTKYSESYHPVLTNKQFYILAIITSLATTLSIPVLLSTAWTGLLFSAISAISLYIVCDLRKKDIQKSKNQSNFKKQYKTYQRNLADYRSGNSICNEKCIETTYTQINQIDKSYLKFFPKIKMLIKNDDYKEAS